MTLHRAGQADLAEVAYRELLAEDLDDAETKDLLGVLLGQQARHLEALVLHNDAVRLRPRSARFRANLGTTLISLQRHEDAVGAFSVACDLEPDSHELHVDRGTALALLDRHVEAMEAFRTSLRISPANCPGWIGLGQSAQALGKTTEALKAFREAASLEPRNALAHANCGAVLSELGEHTAAVRACQVAVECDPGSVDVRLNLASALMVSGSTDHAEAAYRAAIEIDAGRPQAHIGLADVHYALGGLDESMSSLDRALILDPDNLVALCNLGRIKVEIGEFAEAESLYRRALRSCPEHGPAWIGLAETRKFTSGDVELATMSRLLKDPLLGQRYRIEIGFAYAKACDDAGHFAAGGSLLVETNALARLTFHYDVSDDEKRMREIEEIVDAGLVAGWSAAGSDSSRPIFIVGMPRSGTTLLEQMLSSHPLVHGAGELADLPRLARSALPGDCPRHMIGLNPESVSRVGREYLRTLDRIDHESRHVIDKLTTNFEYVGLIAAMFPNATILHCERDALDTCWSCFQRPFSDGKFWSYDRAEIARYYRAYRRLMDHWIRVLPGRVHTIQYEMLVADPERVLRELLNLTRLPWDAASLRFYSNLRPVKTASASQVRRPLYSTSIGRSRRYGSLLDPLVSGLSGIVDATAARSFPVES